MSAKDFASQFEITSPCSENWDTMIGNDRIRFCSHCQRSVHDLSTLNRKQIKRLLMRSQGRLCVRYSAVNPVPTAAPVRALYKIGRTTSIIAASAFSASLSLSSAMAANVISKQGLNSQLSNAAAVISLNESLLSGGTGTIHGVIFDPNGAVISGASITITNVETKDVTMAFTDPNGHYTFSSIQTGTYNLRVQATGFAPSDVFLITLRENDNNRVDQTLSIAPINEAVEVTDDKVVIMGGSMIALPTDPLVKAALDDNLEAVKEALREHNANVRDKSTESNALEHAVRNGNREMIQLLLWAKADVNARDRNGQTVLMMIDEDVTPDIVWDLLNAGAKVNLRDEDGDTALSEIATVNNTEVMKALLDAGAKVNTANNEGQTPLMRAASAGLVNNIRLLIHAGADINQHDKQGKTALTYAQEDEHRPAVRLLLSLGAVEVEVKEKVDKKQSFGVR